MVILGEHNTQIDVLLFLDLGRSDNFHNPENEASDW